MLVCLETTTSGGALTQRSLASTQIYVDAINDVRTSHIPSKPSELSDGFTGYPTCKYKTGAEVAYYRLQTQLYQKNSIVPSSVVLFPEDILSHEAVGQKASAIVYRAWHKKKEVAVKQYILRRSAKKVCDLSPVLLQLDWYLYTRCLLTTP